MKTSTDMPIGSRDEFRDALRLAFAEAAAAHSPALWLVDTDFADWPLGEAGVVDHLGRWAGAGRRLVLVVQSFDELARRHPRWVAWRRVHAHRVSCRINLELGVGAMPTVLLADATVSVRRFDSLHHRGRFSRDPADALRCRELVDAVLQRSEEAFSATVTGL